MKFFYSAKFIDALMRNTSFSIRKLLWSFVYEIIVKKRHESVTTRSYAPNSTLSLNYSKTVRDTEPFYITIFLQNLFVNILFYMQKSRHTHQLREKFENVAWLHCICAFSVFKFNFSKINRKSRFSHKSIFTNNYYKENFYSFATTRQTLF